MKRKNIAALAVAGAAALGLGIHPAHATATILPMSGANRTVASKSTFPGSLNVRGQVAVSNLSGPAFLFGGPITVTCSLQSRMTGTAGWNTEDTDHVFIAGGLQSGADGLDVQTDVEATARMTFRVVCSSVGPFASEPTVVDNASIAITAN